MSHETLQRYPLPWALVLVLALASVPALAAPSPEAVRQAQAHFKLGTAHYEVGSHDLALAEYEAAWKLDPRPLLLFNIGQCHRQLGNREAAIEHYQRYLAAIPNGSVSDRARKYVAQLRRELRQAQAEQRAPSSASAAAASTPTAPSAPAPAEVPAPPATLPGETSTPTSRGPRRDRRCTS